MMVDEKLSPSVGKSLVKVCNKVVIIQKKVFILVVNFDDFYLAILLHRSDEFNRYQTQY